MVNLSHRDGLDYRPSPYPYSPRRVSAGSANAAISKTLILLSALAILYLVRFYKLQQGPEFWFETKRFGSSRNMTTGSIRLARRAGTNDLFVCG
jgi:hypothetical protein